ncbi:uncharacterized protein ISCGN_006971 [Ixodes scapularis]
MRNRNVSWHIFPKDSHIRQLWIQAIVEKTVLPQSWEPKPSYKVCGCHFNPSGTRGYMDKVPQFLEPGTFSVVTNEAVESPTEVIAAAAEPMSPVPALSVSSTTTNDSVGLLWDSVSFPTCVSHEITMECEDTSSRASGVEEQSTRLLWDSMDFPMPVSLEMTRCEDVPSRAPGAGEHDSEEHGTEPRSSTPVGQDGTAPHSEECQHPVKKQGGRETVKQVEQCVHQRKVATLEGTIEQQKRHIVRLQESLAKERNGHEQRVQELLKENEQHKLRICHLEGRLAEGVKQTSEKTNVSFTVQLMSDVERLRFYTGFSSVERFQRFVEFVSDGYKVHKEDQTGKGVPAKPGQPSDSGFSARFQALANTKSAANCTTLVVHPFPARPPASSQSPSHVPARAPNPEEVLLDLSRMKTGSAPDQDGFSAEFYWTFRDVLGKYPCAMLREFFIEHRLPESFERGRVVLEPKEGGDPDDTSVRHPITLLNASYKLHAKGDLCLSCSVKASLPVTRVIGRGCPLSPLLFVRTLQPFLPNVDRSPQVCGLPLPRNIKVNVSVYDDGITLYRWDTDDLGTALRIFRHLQRRRPRSRSAVSEDMWMRLVHDIKAKVDRARSYALPSAQHRYLAYSVIGRRLWYLAQAARSHTDISSDR